MKFDINNYDDTYVMHCPTEEKAIIFLSHLDSLGKTWRGGKSYNDYNRYSQNGSETCYRFASGKYSDMNYYESHGYTILEFDDFNWDDDLDINEEANDMLNSFLKEFSSKAEPIVVTKR